MSQSIGPDSEIQIPDRLMHLNACSEEERCNLFREVCHSQRWIRELNSLAPYKSLEDLIAKGTQAWTKCEEPDWKEALAGHPRIGEKAQGNQLASRWSRGEQAAAADSDQEAAERLRTRQQEYEERFGYLFLICATGKSRQEIIDALEARLLSEPKVEMLVVSKELAKIISLRLEKLVTQ